jgi:hypothetical protein
VSWNGAEVRPGYPPIRALAADVLVQPLHPRLSLRRLALRVTPERLRQPIGEAGIEPGSVAPVHERLFFVTAGRLQCGRQCEPDLCVVRHLFQRRLVARQRLWEPAQRGQCSAAMTHRIGVVRDQRQRGVLARQCLLMVAETLQCHAKVVVCFGDARVLLYPLPQQRNALFNPVLPKSQQSEIAQRAGMDGLQSEHLLVKRFGFVQPVLAVQRERLIEYRLS